MSDPVRAAWLEPLALPSVRGAWLRFGIVLLVAVLIATGVALSRKNQFHPIPTATLGSSGHVDVGGYRFTVVHPLRPIPTPQSEYDWEDFDTPGTQWFGIELTATTLRSDDLGGCQLELRTDTGSWNSNSTLAARANTVSSSPSSPSVYLPDQPRPPAGQTQHLIGYFQVPERELVNQRVVIQLNGLPAQAVAVKA